MMTVDDTDPETVARATLSLLETRLRRLEYLVTGSPNNSGFSTSQPARHDDLVKSTDTIAAKLDTLQRNLDTLRKDHGSVGNLVRDVEALHAKVPELFVTAISASQTPDTSNLSTLSSTVLAHAPLYPTTASRLSSLQSLTVPSAAQSAHLIALQPRISAALQKQQELEIEAEELRQRSAKCLEWWIKIGVVGMGEMWEDWEWRVSEVEKGVRRAEKVEAGR